MQKDLLRRFLLDETGQDLIEYGLLTGIVTAAGVAVFATIRDQMGDLYAAWHAGFQDEEKWLPLPPSS